MISKKKITRIEKAFGKDSTKIGDFFNPTLPNIASNWLLNADDEVSQ